MLASTSTYGAYLSLDFRLTGNYVTSVMASRKVRLYRLSEFFFLLSRSTVYFLGFYLYHLIVYSQKESLIPVIPL